MVRVIACWLMLLLVVQGMAVAGQRVLPGGHVHNAPLRGHSHGHDADVHFHLAVGFHAHDPAAPGVVQIDDDATAAELEMNLAIKRLALDQPQLAPEAPRADAPVAGPAMRRSPAVVPRSYIGDPHERPPRAILL